MQHKDLLAKAGLTPTDKRITMLAKKIMGQSYSLENKILVQYGSASQVVADRADIPEVTVPYVVQGIIKGYWANGLTPDEQKLLQSVYGLPIYTEDSEIPLEHDKTYDLTVPAQKAEYMVVKATGTVSETQEMILDSQNYYFVDQEESEKVRKTDLSSKINLAKTIGTFSNPKKITVLLAYHYKVGMLDDSLIEQKESDITDQYDELVFADARGLNNVISDSSFELKAKIQLYLLSGTVVLGAGNDYYFDSGNGRERIGPNKESVERFATQLENAEKLNDSFDRKCEIKRMSLLKSSISNPVLANEETEKVEPKDYPDDLEKASRQGWTLGEIKSCDEARLNEYGSFLIPTQRGKFEKKELDDKRTFAIKNFILEP